MSRNPAVFARVQWDTWRPPGWFDDAEFAATAQSFTSPDWVAITLNAYRARHQKDEQHNPRYDPHARRPRETEQLYPRTHGPRRLRFLRPATVIPRHEAHFLHREAPGLVA